MHILISQKLFTINIGRKSGIFQRFPAHAAFWAGKPGLVFIHSIICFIRVHTLDRYPLGVYTQNTPKGYLGNNEVLTYGR